MLLLEIIIAIFCIIISLFLRIYMQNRIIEKYKMIPPIFEITYWKLCASTKDRIVFYLDILFSLLTIVMIYIIASNTI